MPSPTVASITPNRGAITGNTLVDITGTNFDPQVNVKFGNLDGLITQVTPTLIKVQTPAAMAPGAVDVKVKNPNATGVTLIGGFTYDPLPIPTIISIAPNRGPIAGNTAVDITGTNFDPQVNVKFGNLDGTISQVTPTLIKVKTPAVTTTGAVDVKVKNPNVTGATLIGGFTYDPLPMPTVTSISPNHGVMTGNTNVDIAGANFDPQVNVKFGNFDGTITQVTPTLIKVKTPPTLVVGPVDVKVKNPAVAGITFTGGFTYDPLPMPSVTTISPNRGALTGNTAVDIAGANFDPQVNVKFGNLDGTITQVTPTLIKVKTPAVTTAGPVDVKVKNPLVAGITITNGFTYDPPPAPPTPTVTSINPNHGALAGNTNVDIAGANFDPQVNVKFGNLDGTITQVTPTLIKVKTPAVTAAGPVDVKVKNPLVAGITITNGFTYDPPSAPSTPTVSSINPNHGALAGNTAVDIAGANFDPQVNVKFGTLDGTITQVTPTLIKVKTPAMTTAGPVDVKVKNPLVAGITITGGFTYDSPTAPPAPTVTSINPNHGALAGNTMVDISGTNFDPQVNVKFGTLDGTITQVTPTLIKVKTPAMTTAGPVDVKVKNPLVAGITITGGFTYDSPTAPPAPTVTSINPNHGALAGNTMVDISGTNFDPQVNVKFGNLDGTITQVTPTLIKVKTPAMTTAGPVDVKVKNPLVAGITITGGFTYDSPTAPPAPTVTSINPNHGALAGNTMVDISGTNFDPQVNVKFGNLDGTITQVTPTLIKVKTPAMTTAGPVDVKVKNPLVAGITITGGFTYDSPTAPPTLTVTSINPNNGALAGNTMVDISGTNFDPQVNVKFGNLDGTITQVTPTLITVKTPAMTTAGPVDVKVKNPLVAGITITGGFTYDSPTAPPAPTVTSINPNRGALTGNTMVDITGMNFDPQVNVKFGDLDGLSIQVLNGGTLIKVKTPAGMAAGAVDVKVKNPLVSGVTITAGFTYVSAPVINEVSLNFGPQQQDPPQVVSILGAFFQTGAIVLFGQKMATVVLNAPDGKRIDVQVPSGADKGPVPVTVRNPDGQESVLANGFTYLGPKQSMRPRIGKLSPLTVLENTNTTITLRGLNLKQAFDEKLIVVRGPGQDAAQITITNGQARFDPLRNEDVVTFNLQVTVPGGLDIAEQLPLFVAASLRPGAPEDLLLEGNPMMFSVVSKALPVPLGFSAKITNDGPNLVMMVGRNLTGTRLEVWQGPNRLETPEQQAKDDLVYGIFQVSTPDQTTPLNLRLVNTRDNDRVVGTYNLTLLPPSDLTVQPTSITSGGAVFDLEPAGNVRLVGSPSGAKAAVNIKTGQYLSRGNSDPNSEHLKSGIGLQVIPIGFQLALFDRAVILPAFSRAKEGEINLSPINVGVGKIFALQGLSLLLFVRVTLQVQSFVAVVPIFDPFDDIVLVDGFNDFSNELPSPFSGFPGAILFELQFNTLVSIQVIFALGLVKPPPMSQGQETFQVLVAEGIGVSATDRGFEFEGGFALGARINSVGPMGGTNKVRHLASINPVPDDAGFRGFYFAERAGNACLPWHFNLTLIKRFSDNSEEEEIFDIDAPICITIQENQDAVDFTLMPLFLPLVNDPAAPDHQGTLTAIDSKNNKLKPGTRVKFARVGPPIVTLTDQTETELVTAEPMLTGSCVIEARVTTQGAGFALLPSPDLRFDVEDFVNAGGLPRAVKEATVTVSAANAPSIVSISPNRGLVGSSFIRNDEMDNRVVLTITKLPSVNFSGLPTIKVTGEGIKAETKGTNGPKDALEITADFTIAIDAEPGDHIVTVEFIFGGKTLTTKPEKFFVQVPTFLGRHSFPADTKIPEESKGISILKIVNKEIPIGLDGKPLAGFMGPQNGAYRILLYEALDQDKQPINQDYMLGEQICAMQSPAGFANQAKDPVLVSPNQLVFGVPGVIDDFVGFLTPDPGKPPSGSKRIATQSFTVTPNLPLRTMNQIVEEIDDKGVAKISITPMEAGTVTIPPIKPPVFTAFDPPKGSPKDPVTITGENFNCVKRVEIIGKPADFKVESSTKIIAVIPPFRLGEILRGVIKVTTADGMAEKDGFQVKLPTGKTATEISPVTDPFGTTLTGEVERPEVVKVTTLKGR